MVVELIDGRLSSLQRRPTRKTTVTTDWRLEGTVADRVAVVVDVESHTDNAFSFGSSPSLCSPRNPLLNHLLDSILRGSHLISTLGRPTYLIAADTCIESPIPPIFLKIAPLRFPSAPYTRDYRMGFRYPGPILGPAGPPWNGTSTPTFTASKHVLSSHPITKWYALYAIPYVASSTHTIRLAGEEDLQPAPLP